MSTKRPQGGRFATTRWSLVAAAGEHSETALAELCEQYWYPLYAYTRRLGHDADDARDLTQAFFAQLLERRDLAVADRNRGRFRTFLLTSLKNFVGGEWRKATAAKRGGNAETLSLDFDSAEQAYVAEPAHQLDPDAVYQRRWALSVLERAIADVQEEYESAGDGEPFRALRDVISGDPEALPYAELAKKLGRSEGSLRTAASRLRSRWKRRLREIVAETVADEGEIQDELQSLIAALGAGV